MLRIRGGTTKLSASKKQLRKVPNDLVGAAAITRKTLSCPVFINLLVNNIPARNIFQLYALWLPAIITIRKANSIPGITVEQCKISQWVSMQQTKAMCGFCMERLSDYRKLFWSFIYLPTVCQPSRQRHPVICSFFPIIFSKGAFSRYYYGISNLCLQIQVYYWNLRGFLTLFQI